MKDFRQRKQKNNFMYSPIALVVLFLILVLLLFSVSSSYQKRKRARVEQQKIDDTYNSLIEKKEYYSSEIDRLSSDEGLIEEFKKNNDVAENGETIIRIVDSN